MIDSQRAAAAEKAALCDAVTGLVMHRVIRNPGPVPSQPAAVKSAGTASGAPLIVARRVLRPPWPPSTQLATAAIPAESVITVSPVTLPPPLWTAKVTVAPATG